MTPKQQTATGASECARHNCPSTLISCFHCEYGFRIALTLAHMLYSLVRVSRRDKKGPLCSYCYGMNKMCEGGNDGPNSEKRDCTSTLLWVYLCSLHIHRPSSLFHPMASLHRTCGLHGESNSNSAEQVPQPCLLSSTILLTGVDALCSLGRE